MSKKVAKSRMYKLNKASETLYELIAPNIKGLVLSGGGARGIAYAGMLRALFETGRLDLITHVTGASAGAMTASFIALGMDHKEVGSLISQVTLSHLLDTEGYTRVRAKGNRFRNFFEVIYYLKIKSYLEEVKTRLNHLSDAEIKTYNHLNFKKNNYGHVLKNFNLTCVDDFISLCASAEKMKRLDSLFEAFTTQLMDKTGNPLENSRFTFSDFERLKTLFPESLRSKFKHLSVVTANLTTQQLEEYNADVSPNISVAEKVQLSGAHPLIFSPVKNIKGEYVADGAFIDNMPAHVLINLGLDHHEVLCIALSGSDGVEERLSYSRKTSLDFVSTIGQYIDYYFKGILGTEINQYLASSYNREKFYYHIGNMLYLNAGDIGVPDLSNTPAQKKQAVDMAYKTTLRFFEKRNKTFDNYLLALMYLNIDDLSEIIQQNSEQLDFVFYARKANELTQIQHKTVKSLKKKDGVAIELLLKEVMAIIKADDLNLSQAQRDKILCLCLKQINYLSKGKLEAYCLTQIEENTFPQKQSWFMAILTLLKQTLHWIFSPLITYFTPDFFKVEPPTEEEKHLFKIKAEKLSFFQSVQNGIEHDNTPSLAPLAPQSP